MIKKDIKTRISEFYKSNPIAIGKKATASDVNLIESKLKLKLDEDYIDFITSFGGGLIGSSEIYSMSNSSMMDEDIIELNETYKNDNFWEGIDNWIIIGSDHSGNPIGIDLDGKIVSNDHDFGGIYVIAESFSDYLITLLDDCDND